jgi:hypothetical protein
MAEMNGRILGSKPLNIALGQKHWAQHDPTSQSEKQLGERYCSPSFRCYKEG